MGSYSIPIQGASLDLVLQAHKDDTFVTVQDEPIWEHNLSCQVSAHQWTIKIICVGLYRME